MKKLAKPYAKSKNYNCFGCSPHNPFGLNMEFTDTGDKVECIWTPQRNFEGFHNVLHGGIQATLIDEIAAWCVNIQAQTSGLTINLNMQYLKPVYVDKGEILLSAFISGRKKNIVIIDVELRNSDNEICSKGEVRYFTFSPEKAASEFDFPGINAFYEEG